MLIYYKAQVVLMALLAHTAIDYPYITDGCNQMLHTIHQPQS